MPAKPRLLIITPDFPPARGGIQVLAHRLAGGLEGFQTRVVTADSEGAKKFDAEGELSIRRVKSDRRLGASRECERQHDRTGQHRKSPPAGQRISLPRSGHKSPGEAGRP